jgi:hypothetical protein
MSEEKEITDPNPEPNANGISLGDPASSSINIDGSFSLAIRNAIEKYKPSKLFETGTFDGSGSTTVIAMAMKEFLEPTARLITVECDPKLYKIATENMQEYWPLVHCRLGVSVPFKKLPTKQEIIEIVKSVPEGIAVDWPELALEDRSDHYFGETDKKDYLEDVIRKSIEFEFRARPGFVLLDSAGHMGTIEFDHLMIYMCKAKFILALDDVKHIKHYRTMEKIKADPRWKILSQGDERFGWAIAEYTPEA